MFGAGQTSGCVIIFFYSSPRCCDIVNVRAKQKNAFEHLKMGPGKKEEIINGMLAECFKEE